MILLNTFLTRERLRESPAVCDFMMVKVYYKDVMFDMCVFVWIHIYDVIMFLLCMERSRDIFLFKLKEANKTIELKWIKTE